MYFEIVEGPSKGRRVDLDHEPVVIGRSGHVRLDDEKTSRVHARVAPREDGWYVQDLESTNGTYVNRCRLSERARLKSGDVIQIGQSTFIVRDDRIPPYDENGGGSAVRDVRDVVGRTADLPPTHPTDIVLAPPTRGSLRRRHATTTDIAQQVEEPRPLMLAAEVEVLRAHRRWGPLVVTTVILTLCISLLLNAIFFLYTRTAVDGVRAAVEEQAGQAVALRSAVLQEIRALPGPPDIDRPLKELGARLDVQAQRQTRETVKQVAASVAESVATQQKRATDEELALLRQILSEMRAAPKPGFSIAVPPAPRPARPPIQLGPLQSPAEPVLASTTGAVAAPAAAATPSHPDVIFVVDATRGLNAILPQVLQEVRRAMRQTAHPETCRILLLYRSRLLDLPGPVLTGGPIDQALVGSSRDASGADPRQVSLPRALELAFAAAPAAVHILADDFTGVRGSPTRLVSSLNTAGATVHVTHFHSRQHREDFKSLARDHGGLYTFIP